jgi:cytochrome c oxidase cbb3-type subunit 3
MPRFLKMRTLLLAALLFLAPNCARRSGAQEVPSQAPPSALAPAASSAGTAKAATETDGAKLYERYCALCHGKDAKGYAADNAPSLVSERFLESATDAFIATAIRNGRPNTAMAAYGTARGGALEEPQITALVRFLRSQGKAPLALSAPGPGDAAKGGQLYTQYCISCHATPGQRGTAPQLHNPEFLASASPAFIRHSIVHGRPPTPMPPFGERLKAEEIDSIVAYVMALATLPGAAPADAKVPDNLALVINPKGRAPRFKLREDRYVSAEQVKKALDAKQRLVIVDARSPADWLLFHIPGSVPIPYYDTDKLEKLPKDGTWILAYCACPHHASGEVVDALRKRNYPHTAVLDEGILFWKDKGYPLAGSAATPAPSASPAPARASASASASASAPAPSVKHP